MKLTCVTCGAEVSDMSCIRCVLAYGESFVKVDKTVEERVSSAHACHCDAREEATCRRVPECRPSYCKLSQGVIDV